MTKQRRHFAGTEKVAILKRHLLDKVPISDLCDELDIYPNQFYDWLKKFFENGHLAFANGRSGRKPKAVENAKDRTIEQLRDNDQAPAAVTELVRRGKAVVPDLLSALERRDPESPS